MQKTAIESLEDLSDDLHAEILCRVPYKQLMRCKCVSKRWFFLISNPDPYFTARQSFFSKTKTCSWTWMYYSTKKKKLIPAASKDPLFLSEGFSFSFLPCYQPTETSMAAVEVVALVNDLFVCCASKSNIVAWDDIDDDVVYYICNPLTKQWVALPPTCSYAHVHVHLICESYEKQEDNEGMTLCGFKVVRVILSLRSFPRALHLDVFSSETREWVKRKVMLHPDKHFTLHPLLKTMTCNGAMYVASLLKGGLDGKIMLFNLTSVINDNDCVALDSGHQCDVFGTPKAELLSVMTCQGRLRAVVLVIRKVPVLYILELRDDYKANEWNLVHRVCLTEMVTFTNKEWFSDIVQRRLPPQDGTCRFKALDFEPGDSNILHLILCGRMASYDMLNKVLTFYTETKSLSKPCSNPSKGKKSKPFLKVVLPLQPTSIRKL